MSARRLITVTVVAGLLLASSSGGLGRSASRPLFGFAPASAFAAAAHCCFTNPRFVGTCDVEPSSDETCSSILAYLNNPQSQGKTYCGSTSIRGDWKSVACQPQTAGD